MKPASPLWIYRLWVSMSLLSIMQIDALAIYLDLNHQHFTVSVSVALLGLALHYCVNNSTRRCRHILYTKYRIASRHMIRLRSYVDPDRFATGGRRNTPFSSALDPDLFEPDRMLANTSLHVITC